MGVVACAPAMYPDCTGVWPYQDVWCQISGIVHGTSVSISIWSISMVIFFNLFTQYITQIIQTKTLRPHAHVHTHNKLILSLFPHSDNYHIDIETKLKCYWMVHYEGLETTNMFMIKIVEYISNKVSNDTTIQYHTH